MDQVVMLIFLLLAVAAIALLIGWRMRSRPGSTVSIHSSIEQIREIGHLSVFKVFTKEIVTETKHDWGGVGSQYLSWIFTSKKMAMVFEFEIDFRYDLRSPAFRIQAAGPGAVIVHMPPCMHEVHLKNVHFYDEQHAKLLPWLLPDLLNGFFSRGFTEEDKNKLVAAARAQAESHARSVINNFTVNVEGSATTTLRAICRSLGAKEVVLDFEREASPQITVTYGAAA